MEWERLFWVAVGIVGTIEFIKQPFGSVKVPGWVWWALQGLACVGVAFVSGGTAAGIMEHAMLYIAATAIGYGSLIKLVQAAIERFRQTLPVPKP